MLNEYGYLIGINRETQKFEELSTLSHRTAAESYVQVEAKLNELYPGGLHAEYYNISFVDESNIEYCRELIYRVNEEHDASTVIGFCFITTIIVS